MNALARTAMRTVLPRYEIIVLASVANNLNTTLHNEREAVGSLAKIQDYVLQRVESLLINHGCHLWL